MQHCHDNQLPRFPAAPPVALRCAFHCLQFFVVFCCFSFFFVVSFVVHSIGNLGSSAWPTTSYCSSGWDQRGVTKEISSRDACCRPTTDVIWALLKAQRHWKARRLTSSALWWLATTCVSVVSFTKVVTRLIKLRNPECHYDPRPLAAAPPVTGPATARSRKGGTFCGVNNVPQLWQSFLAAFSLIKLVFCRSGLLPKRSFAEVANLTSSRSWLEPGIAVLSECC